jgi:HlyD family secretion protein
MKPSPQAARARWFRYGLLALVVLTLAALALWPSTVRVDSAMVERGTVRDTFEAEGRTRVRDRYLITAPMTATARRLGLEPGDAVEAGQVLVTLDAATPPALAQAARAEADSAERAAALARSELDRLRPLAAQGMVPQDVLQRAETDAQRSALALQGARFRQATAAHQQEAARALLQPIGSGGTGPAVLQLRAPASGVVLRRHFQSARTVQPGEPLLEIGDPSALEVEVDVLSSDAVRLRVGQPVELLRWGGAPPLIGEVRRIEPVAFTKVSALGVEEQRVWVIVDILSPREQWAPLGEAYRVHARFVLQTATDTLHVPSGALHRSGPSGTGWAVFRIEGGKARLQAVETGLQGEGRTEIRQGLAAGDRVVLHPPRELADGARVATP